MGEDRILAWHFVSTDIYTKTQVVVPVLRDGRPVVVGEVVTHDGPMELCKSGLHASVRARDALRYAPGCVVCRVECWGDVEQDKDKLVCRNRKVLWMADATKARCLWSCDGVERVLMREREVGYEPDPRSWEALVVARKFISGECDMQELKEATARAFAVAPTAFQGYAPQAVDGSACVYAAIYAARINAVAYNYFDEVEQAWHTEALEQILLGLAPKDATCTC